MDRRLLKAIAHPMRVRILAELENRDTLTPLELSEEWHEPLGVVAYHFRRLHALGFVEIARRTSRRGAIQKHYRVLENPRSLTSRAGLERSVRTAMLGAQLELLMADLDGAVARGAFDSRSAWLSHSRVTLDAEGRRQLADAMTAWDQRARDIALHSAARLEASGSVAHPAVVALLLFDEADVPDPPVSIPRARRAQARYRAQ
jgi:DNA-binding transcriptional ArsR family regulator